MRPSALPLSSSSRVRGFSLLEVLISVIVLSFGVLGMVGVFGLVAALLAMVTYVLQRYPGKPLASA